MTNVTKCCTAFLLHITKTNDQKDFKALLRTRTNVLVIYTKDEEHAAYKKWIPILNTAADKMYGRATIVVVNCGDTEGKKLCKKYKVAPDTVLLKHYHNGEYNRDYDRREAAESVVLFLEDPKGDVPWEEDASGANVHHVPSATVGSFDSLFAFNRLVKKEKLPILVMFYAPWCGHCKRLKPEYGAAAAELKDSAILAAVDCTRPDNSQLQEVYNVSGYPTLLYFKDGKLQHPYGGQNTQKSLVDWMKNPTAPSTQPAEEEKPWSETEPNVKHLDDATFEPFIAENDKVLVMFYAPWCGHCKAMKPDYGKAAETIKAAEIEGVLAAVDATQAKGLAEKYKIQGFPTLKFFENGEFRFDFNQRSFEELVGFMKNPEEPPPPPPPEQPWHEQESDVVHLTDENFKAEVKRKKHALVMFYAPWCGHCKKAKPEFTEAAMLLNDLPKIMLAAVDCTVHQSVCSEFDVQGFPTIKLFAYGKNPVDYPMARDARSFTEFMWSVSGVAPLEAERKAAEDPNARPPQHEEL